MIKIRKLQKSDEKQLLDLAIQFFKKEQRGKIVSKKLLPLIKYKDYDKHLKEDVKKYMKLDPRRAIIFVAEDDKKLIGYIYGRIDKRPKMVLDKCGIIEDWFVKEKYRGRGIGEMLWDKLMKWFKSKKCNCLKTDAYSTNKLAVNIYHKLGFIDKKIVMLKKL
jgi:ribosomal protein S18 acetylase RimI-like enzyme